MDPVYRALPDLDLDFSGARACFDGLLEKVRAQDTMQLSHDQVERLVETEGRDVLRQVFQGHLDLRAAAEQGREAPRGADEAERRQRRSLERPLRSVFGDNRVARLNFKSKDVPSPPRTACPTLQAP